MSNSGELRGITVGSGHFAQVQLDAWRSVKGATIVGVVSADDLRHVARIADDYGVGFSGQDLGDAVAHLFPDFIDICTPPESHGELIRAGAEMGIPVLCQKPLAPTLKESIELVEYCRLRGVALAVNENWRWQPWYREMRRLIDSGAIGTVHHLMLIMRPGDGWGPRPYPEQPYFASLDPFLILETGIHYFDTVRYLMGDIERVWCHTRTVNPVVRGEDAAVVVMQLASGATAVYDADRAAIAESERSRAYGWALLEGNIGSLRLDPNGGLWMTQRGARESPHEYVQSSGWMGGAAVAAQQHFVDCLRSGESSETSGSNYIRTMAAVSACYKSATSGNAVSIAEILSAASAGVD